MAAIDRYDAAFGMFVQRYLRDNMHTGIRGKVVGVDYSGPTVDIQPMAFTELASGTKQTYPTIYDVPLQLPSGNGGKARLTMPVKVGDTVGLTFSERNEDDNTDITTHQLFPGWAVSQIFTSGNKKPIDPNNVVLENDKVKAELTPEGDWVTTTPSSTTKQSKEGGFEFTNNSSSLRVTPQGQFQFTNGSVTIQGNIDGTGSLSNASGGINLKANGETDVNGGLITQNGNFITGNGVNLDNFYQDYLSHRHGGVETGSGISGTKV